MRNSEMGWADKIAERSPLAMRWISGCRSSYLITGILDLNVSRTVDPSSLNRFRYSVSPFRLKISANTLSWTESALRVISSMNWSAFASFSDAAGPRGDERIGSTAITEEVRSRERVSKRESQSLRERGGGRGRESLLGSFNSSRRKEKVVWVRWMSTAKAFI